MVLNILTADIFYHHYQGFRDGSLASPESLILSETVVPNHSTVKF